MALPCAMTDGQSLENGRQWPCQRMRQVILQKGDVLISEAQTGAAIDGQESLDAMLESPCIRKNSLRPDLTVLRNGPTEMQLTQE